MKLHGSREKPIAVALRNHLSLPVAVGVSAAIALSGSSLAAAYPVDEPFRERPGSDHSTSHRELLFVDPFVADPEQLLIALRPNVETIILEADRGGLEQITEALEQRRDIKAIHIVAHGEAGSLNLAGTTLTEASLSGASELLEGWFTDQPERPEILLYACDLARGPEGLAFVERLSSLAGADVAASTDLTGQGGDWELEYHLGQIATASAFNNGLIKGWSHTLATFTVNSLNDSGAGSLREAISDANAAGGEDTIEFDVEPGTITLTSGPLEVTDSVVITGPGSEVLTLRSPSDPSYRSYRGLLRATADLEVEGVTIAYGYSQAYGGCIHFNDDTGDLVLRDVTIENCFADDGGGGLFANAYSVLIENSTIRANQVGQSYGGGGGIAMLGNLNMVDSQVSNNSVDYSAYGNGGGVLVDNTNSYFDATVYIKNSEISDNSAGDGGGGAWLSGAYVYLVGTKFENNSAGYDGGGARIDADSEIVINNSQFLYNAAGYDGGGLWVELEEAEYLSIENSTISRNTSYSSGGGIHIYFDDGGDSYTNAVVIRNTDVTYNYAEEHGGGISIYADDAGSFVKIFASNISGNDAYYIGGGIRFYTDDDGSLFIRDSTISDNTAQSGGGISFYSDDGYLSVSNSTVSHNSARYEGGGIAIRASDEAVFIGTSTIVFNSAYGPGDGIYAQNHIYVSNSIISDNDAGTGFDIFFDEGNALVAHYSLLGTTNVVPAGANNIYSSSTGVSPDLQNLGGPTLVHALSEASPAVNAGVADFPYFDFDQRGDGFPRVKGGRIDIGAVESDFGEVASALNPTFGAPTSNADGFTVQISNYDAAYEWAATSTEGSVAIDGDLVTVTGLASAQSATVTVTTTRTNYSGGSADVTGSATVTEQTVGPVTLRITPLASSSSCSIDELSVDSAFPSGADGVAVNGIGVGVAFTLTGCNASTPESVTISIDFGSALPEGSVAMKIDNDGNWSAIDGATIEGSIVAYTLTDNDGVLDQDPNAGTMTDPVTVAVPFTAPVVPVPTLPGLLLGLLSSLLGLAGLGRMRHEQKKRG